jgi:hypothetical protein
MYLISAAQKKSIHFNKSNCRIAYPWQHSRRHDVFSVAAVNMHEHIFIVTKKHFSLADV